MMYHDMQQHENNNSERKIWFPLSSPLYVKRPFNKALLDLTKLYPQEDLVAKCKKRLSTTRLHYSSPSLTGPFKISLKSNFAYRMNGALCNTGIYHCRCFIIIIKHPFSLDTGQKSRIRRFRSCCRASESESHCYERSRESFEDGKRDSEKST